MADLTLEFKTVADVQGALAIEQHLDAQIKRAQLLGETERANALAKQRDTASGNIRKWADASPENLELLKKAKETMGETAHESHAMHLGLHLAGEELRRMGIELPGLHHLLRGAFSPEMLGLVAGTAAITAFVEHLKKANEEAEKLRTVLIEMPERADSLAKALQDAAVEAESFADHSQRLAAAQPTLQEQLAKTNSILEEQRTLQDGIAKSHESLTESLIKMAVSQGKLNEQQAASLRFQETIRDYLSAQGRDQQAQESELARLTSAKTQAQKDLTTSASAVPAQTQRVKSLEAEISDLQTKIKGYQDLLQGEEIQKLPEVQGAMLHAAGRHTDWTKMGQAQLDALMKELEAKPGYLPSPSGPVPTEAGHERQELHEFLLARAAFERIHGQFTTATRGVSEGEARLPGLQIELNRAKADLDDNKQKSEAAAKAIRDFTTQIDELTRKMQSASAQMRAEFPSLAVRTYGQNFPAGPQAPGAPDFRTLLRDSGATNKMILDTIAAFNREQRELAHQLQHFESQSKARTTQLQSLYNH